MKRLFRKKFKDTSTQEPLRGVWLLSRESDNSLTAPLNQGRECIVKWKGEKQMNSLKRPLMYNIFIWFTPGLPPRIGNYAYFCLEKALVARAVVARFQCITVSSNIRGILKCDPKSCHKNISIIHNVLLFFKNFKKEFQKLEKKIEK